jgi:hypothetical protein
MEEHGGHEDLCGSGRRSVIPYVHEERCCIAMHFSSLGSKAFKWACLNLTSAHIFVAQGYDSYKGSPGSDRWP